MVITFINFISWLRKKKSCLFVHNKRYLCNFHHQPIPFCFELKYFEGVFFRRDSLLLTQSIITSCEHYFRDVTNWFCLSEYKVNIISHPVPLVLCWCTCDGDGCEKALLDWWYIKRKSVRSSVRANTHTYTHKHIRTQTHTHTQARTLAHT